MPATPRMPHNATSVSASIEQPLPDWAPFAPIGDAEWRELQRRRNLVRMIRALAETAKDEGFAASASMLSETASRIQDLLIASARTSEAAEALHREAQIDAAKLQAANAARFKPRMRAITPDGVAKGRIKPEALRTNLDTTEGV